VRAHRNNREGTQEAVQSRTAGRRLEQEGRGGENQRQASGNADRPPGKLGRQERQSNDGSRQRGETGTASMAEDLAFCALHKFHGMATKGIG